MKLWYSFIASILSVIAYFAINGTAMDNYQNTSDLSSFDIAHHQLGVITAQKEKIQSWGDKIEESKEEKESNLELELSAPNTSVAEYISQNTNYFSQKITNIPKSFFERMKSWNTPLYLQFACLKINC